ncbi:MAG: hypothetical protein BWY57_01312 [Betaproteobacteria bacterium ADurb.Bin341]|nr:MAG: hypothetical protein BWY57_01312 [Betaproteobacteria bacterium ADurb.Bin341]
MNAPWFVLGSGEMPPLAVDAHGLPDDRGDFGKSYVAALAETAFSPEVQARVAARERRVMEVLKAEWENGGFNARYGLQRLLSIGSTARDLYAWLPTDHDLMVETQAPQELIDRDEVRQLLEHLAAQLAVSPEFQASPEEERSLRAIFLSSLKVRGQASLVGRLNAIWDCAHGEEQEDNLVDVTFGNVRRTADYALWMQAYLARLPAEWRARQTAEIRLAKKVFKALGEVYGSQETGLRPITIEQWVIQNVLRQPSGLPIGTFDAVLRHVAKEALPFAEYRARWPVWRPGLTDDEVANSAIHPAINLLELLANGDPVLAEAKWQRIVMLARAYLQRREAGQAWTIEALTASHV